MMEGYKTGFMDKVVYDTTNMERNISLVIYSVIGFFIPFMLQHPQFLVGSAVNMVLVLAAFHLKKWAVIPFCVLPTFGVLAAGILFGPFTTFLIYMMPVIWIGNWLLVAFVKKLYVDMGVNYLVSLSLSILVKTSLLFITAFMFVKMQILPVPFLTAMGVFQIYTALIGGSAAYGVMKTRKYFLK